jgi:FkbM family methyltransferase
MSIIRPPSSLKQKLLSRCIRTFFILSDNTGDSKPERNGEYRFLTALTRHYTGKDFVLFDVGANRGEYTEWLLQQGHFASFSAHLFEPQKSCYEYLHQKFADTPAVYVNHYGLSDSDSTQTLYKNADGSGLSSLYKRDLTHIGVPFDQTETISLKNPLRYVTERSIPHINLMKLDVEGHELAVLRGFGDFLSPKHIDFIQLEYGGANLDSRTTLRDLHQHLTQAGFVLCKVMRRHLEIRPYHPDLENYVYQNWVAVSPRLVSSFS